MQLRNVANRLIGGSANEELSSLNGRLNLIRPSSSARPGRETLFLDCVASVRKTGHAFQSQLVICRAWQEDEEELAQDADESEFEDERALLIDENIDFAVSSPTEHDLEEFDQASDAVFSWWDHENDEEAVLSFIVAKDNAPGAINKFEESVYRAMFERKFGTAGHMATQKDLDAFRLQAQANGRSSTSPSHQDTTKGKLPLFDPPSDEEAVASEDSADEIADDLLANNLSAQLQRTHLSDTGHEAADSEQPALAPEPPKALTDAQARLLGISGPLPENRTQKLQFEVALGVYDQSKGEFGIRRSGAQASVWRATTDDPSVYGWLSVYDQAGELWMSIPINQDFNPSFESAYSVAIIHVWSPATQKTRSWCLKVNSEEVLRQFNHTLAALAFDIGDNNGAGKFDKLSESDQRYIMSRSEAPVEMDLDDPEVLSEDEEDDATDSGHATGTDEEDEDESDDEKAIEFRSRRAAAKGKTTAKFSENTALAVGHQSGLSFVVRGSMIGVFQEDTSSGSKRLKFMTTINDVCTPDGRPFTPKQVMLHQQDGKMLLRDPLNSDVVYEMDLNTGELSDTLHMGGRDIVNMFPQAKFAQTTLEATFLGHSHNSVWRVDPRLSGSRVVESQSKTYATNPDFVAGSSTESGQFAMLTSKGEVKFYDQLGKNAKTAFVAVGRGAFDLDHTKDGKYTVITLADHLLLMDNTIPDGKYTGQLAFDRAYPLQSRRNPVRLELRPEHRAILNQRMQFTKARFNTGPDMIAKSIITSAGPYVISWNLRRVQQGHFDYKIQRYDEDVIADNFKFNDVRDIIVTLKNDVLMENRSALEKPSRKSLGSRIVNSWDD